MTQNASRRGIHIHFINLLYTGPPVKGWHLYRQQLWALLVKRSCCARRDRLAVVTQLAVPILLVLVALWAGKAYVNSPDEPLLELSRYAITPSVH